MQVAWQLSGHGSPRRALRLVPTDRTVRPLPRWQRGHDQIRAAGPAAWLRPALWRVHPDVRQRRTGRRPAAAASPGVCGLERSADAAHRRRDAATLGRDGLVRRYHADDGLDGSEEAFLGCTFWLAE